MPLSLQLYHTGVSGMKSLFDKKVEEHKSAQLENPFSEWEGANHSKKTLSKDDKYYGRPLPGSKSEKRAEIAQFQIMMDIRYMLDMIWDCAEWKSQDGRAAITFGKLFNLYNAISDKLVGTLIRARKHGFVHFEGEMLYQRRDEGKVIELTKNMNTIRRHFGGTPVYNGGEIENNCSEEEHSSNKGRRTSDLEEHEQRRTSIHQEYGGRRRSILEERQERRNSILEELEERSRSILEEHERRRGSVLDEHSSCSPSRSSAEGENLSPIQRSERSTPDENGMSANEENQTESTQESDENETSADHSSSEVPENDHSVKWTDV